MIRGLVVGDELPQHRHEDVDRVRGVALLIRQPAPAKRVVGAVHLRAAVDEEQRRTSHSTNDIILIRCLSCAPRGVLTLARRVSILGTACGSGGGILGKEYEYEEELYLLARRFCDGGRERLDRGARGAARRRFRIQIRVSTWTATASASLFRARVPCHVDACHVATDARFVHVRIDVDDVRQLSRVAPFAWSSYQFRARRATCSNTSKWLERPGEGRRRRGLERRRDRRVQDAHSRARSRITTRRQAGAARQHPGVGTAAGRASEERAGSGRGQHGTGLDPLLDAVLFGATILLAAVAFGVVIWRVARHGREDVGPGPHTRTRPTSSP